MDRSYDAAEISLILFTIAIGVAVIATPFAVSWLAGPPDDCPPAPCCGETIHDLHDRIDRLQAELRQQTAQKIKAMQANQPLQEKVRELETELEACQAHVAFGEEYEVTQ